MNESMTFGQAIEAMKHGKKVARAGWNGKGMYLWLMPGSDCQGRMVPRTSPQGGRGSEKKGEKMIIQRLQNSPITSWIWKFWQHEETGYLVMLPFWKKPGRRYYKIKMKE